MDGICFTPNPKLLHFVRFVGYNYIADELKLVIYLIAPESDNGFITDAY